MAKKKSVKKPPRKTARKAAPRPRAAVVRAAGGKAPSRPKAEGEAASKLIDRRIRELGDWRGEMLENVRRLIHEAEPEVVEEWKWMGTPVWSHHVNICTGETYKSVVKLTFAKGASLEDPSGLFNSSLEGSVRRAIDIHENEGIDEAALRDLVRAAVALNLESQPRRARRGSLDRERSRPTR